MMRLTTLTAQTTPLTVDFGGEKLNLVFAPGVLTPKLAQSLGDGDVATTAKILEKALVSWDLVEPAPNSDETQPVPIELDRLMELPGHFLAKVLTAINEALRPDPTKSTD